MIENSNINFYVNLIYFQPYRHAQKYLEAQILIFFLIRTCVRLCIWKSKNVDVKLQNVFFILRRIRL